MEVSIHSETKRFPDISSSGGSSTTDPHHNKEDLSMTDLKTCLSELLNVEETEISTSVFNPAHDKNHDISSNRVGESDLEKTNLQSPEKCLTKCATFPPPHGLKSSVDNKGKNVEDITIEDSAKPFNQFHSRSTSLPVPLKLVSALKGNREKGTSPKKLSVTWAPDVYDPIPTSVSHFPSDKNQRYRNSKKYGKYGKQKSSGKSSRGSKGKDKKQVRKSSSKPKQPFYANDGGVLDPFCGTSFLKGSVPKLHFPVAEAT